MGNLERPGEWRLDRAAGHFNTIGLDQEAVDGGRESGDRHDDEKKPAHHYVDAPVRYVKRPEAIPVGLYPNEPRQRDWRSRLSHSNVIWS